MLKRRGRRAGAFLTALALCLSLASGSVLAQEPQDTSGPAGVVQTTDPDNTPAPTNAPALLNAPSTRTGYSYDVEDADGNILVEWGWTINVWEDLPIGLAETETKPGSKIPNYSALSVSSTYGTADKDTYLSFTTSTKSYGQNVSFEVTAKRYAIEADDGTVTLCDVGPGAGGRDDVYGAGVRMASQNRHAPVCRRRRRDKGAHLYGKGRERAR